VITHPEIHCGEDVNPLISSPKEFEVRKYPLKVRTLQLAKIRINQNGLYNLGLVSGICKVRKFQLELVKEILNWFEFSGEVFEVNIKKTSG